MAKHDNQHFEVQIFRHGRWFVEARFESKDRPEAIELAKTLNKEERNLPIRVIMEDYHPDTGHHEEIVVFRNKAETSKLKPKKQTSWADMAVSSDGRVGFLGEDIEGYEDPFVPKKRVKAKVSAPMFLGIWMLILASGVAAGGSAAALLALLMIGFQIALTPDSYRFFLLGMFALVFMITTSSMFGYYRARFDLNPFTKKERPLPNIKKSAVSKQMEKAAKAIDAATPDKPSPEAAPAQNIFEQTQEASEAEEEEETFSRAAEQQQVFLVNFLGSILDTLKNSGVGANTLNRFAMNMFMAACVSRAGELHGLSEDEQDIILVKLLGMLGAKTDQCERFALEYEKYLEDPRHAELYDAAANLFESYQKGNQGEILNVRATLDAWVSWKTPEKREEELENPHLLTVMFTDMVGSTDLTTKHGDYAAQEVLKAHDLIVRTALTNFSGTEIKHLGDGIMASFKKHDKAIQASIEIQKRVAGNNRAGPEFPLHVRIGVNVGEPIKKNNDLFGKSVQLAARLCSFANSDSIAISKDLRDYYLDRPPYTFVEAGAQPLKGFEQPQEVYFIDWEAPLIEYSDDEEIDVSEEGDETSAASPKTQATGPVNPEAQPADPSAPDVEVVAPCAASTAPDPDFKEGVPVAQSAKSGDEAGPAPKNV